MPRIRAALKGEIERRVTDRRRSALGHRRNFLDDRESRL
jgi:hypothetical protein